MRLFLKNIIATVLFSSICFSYAYASMSATISLDPKNPEPNSFTNLTLNSYSFDVDTAIITWKVNGTTILQGRGEKTLRVKNGNTSESNQVNVRAETADGSILENVITLTPASVTLIYEAPKSYVPLLYPGRSLASDGGLIQITALPSLSDEGVLVAPSSIAYAWYVDGEIFKEVSGIGKQSALIRLDYLKDATEIKVVARSPLGNIGTKTISIYPHEIMPLLYTYDPIFGSHFASLVDKRFEAVKDFTLNLEPFYVSDKETKSPVYTWFLDGLPTTPLGGRTLSLHPKEDSYGSKKLTITVKGYDSRLQKAESTTELIFDTRQ